MMLLQTCFHVQTLLLAPCKQVPYDPGLPFLFFGEEAAMLARMWTSGWDIFMPPQSVAFHQWERGARAHSFQSDIPLVCLPGLLPTLIPKQSRALRWQQGGTA